MTKLQQVADVIQSARAEYALEWEGKTEMGLDEFLAMAVDRYYKQFMADIKTRIANVEDKIAVSKTYRYPVTLKRNLLEVQSAGIVLESDILLSRLGVAHNGPAKRDANRKVVFDFLGALKKHGKELTK